MKYMLSAALALLLVGCQQTDTTSHTTGTSQTTEETAEHRLPEKIESFFQEAAKLIETPLSSAETTTFDWWGSEGGSAEYPGYKLENTIKSSQLGDTPSEALRNFFEQHGFSLESGADGERMSASTFKKEDLVCLLREGYAEGDEDEPEDSAEDEQSLDTSTYEVEISCGLI